MMKGKNDRSKKCLRIQWKYCSKYQDKNAKKINKHNKQNKMMEKNKDDKLQDLFKKLLKTLWCCYY